MISIVISILALAISVYSVNLYRNYSRKTVAVALEHTVNLEPPHFGPEQSTEVRVTNNGNAIARLNKTTVRFSWHAPEIVYDWEKELGSPYYLAPGEHQSFEIKIPEPEKGGEYRMILTTTYDDGKSKREEKTFSYSPGVVFF